MLDIWSVVPNVLGVAVIALLSQVFRLIPRRARLMAKVERLGSLYALMPESPQKADFLRHLTHAIEELDEWLDPDNSRRRWRIAALQWLLAIAAVALLAAWQVSSGEPAEPARGVGLGLVAGTVIGGITFAVESVSQRRVARRDEADADARDQEAARQRREAIARGEAPLTT